MGLFVSMVARTKRNLILNISWLSVSGRFIRSESEGVARFKETSSGII